MGAWGAEPSPGRRWGLTFPLRGPRGEPVDLARTLNSHGLASLPPIVHDGAGMRMPLLAGRGRARIVRVEPGAPGRAVVTVTGRAPGAPAAAVLLHGVRRVLNLDEDLSGFYALVADDPALSWVAAGAGRMMRAPTVFEDLVKTICTTNCAWSATVRMVSALVGRLGQPAVGAPAAGPSGRLFPTAAAMADAPATFYTDVVRAGYRGRYLRTLARAVASGEVDPEGWVAGRLEPLADEEVEAALLALPGIGPYGAAHMLTLLGRHSRLILDSWTRPTYARLAGVDQPADDHIRDRFAGYGRWAGLAFWLYLTRGWVDD